MTTPVFGITGWKNSGKTTLTERLVTEFTRRGYRISTVKHAHHAFDIDREGADSWRHRQAGASEVAIVSANRLAIMRELRGEAEPSLADVLGRLQPCDLVLVEGYKRDAHAKIEMRSAGAAKDAPLWPSDPTIVAIASDEPIAAADRPVFERDAISEIADFIAAYCGLPPR